MTTKMYVSYGWQNVAEYSRKKVTYPVQVGDYPTEHAVAACGFTHARNESLEGLIADLKKAAGVKHLKYEVVEERHPFL